MRETPVPADFCIVPLLLMTPLPAMPASLRKSMSPVALFVKVLLRTRLPVPVCVSVALFRSIPERLTSAVLDNVITPALVSP